MIRYNCMNRLICEKKDCDDCELIEPNTISSCFDDCISSSIPNVVSERASTIDEFVSECSKFVYERLDDQNWIGLSDIIEIAEKMKRKENS